ncbi:MAG: S41 family peptidase [Gemmataceae bacterium]
MNKAAMFFATLGVGLLTCWLPNWTRAADMPPIQPYVVIVGISEYPDKQIKNRKHAEADAKALYTLLTSKKANTGVNKDQIKLLLGSDDKNLPSEKATRENILGALDWLAQNAKEDDLVLFAFFGQGAPLGERSCYFAVDSTFAERKKNAIGSEEIAGVMKELKANEFVAFLDVHYKGYTVKKGSEPEFKLTGFYREFRNEQKDRKGLQRVVFMANDGLSEPLSTDTQGAFAKVILDGLGGKADKFGYEQDGLITIAELTKHISKNYPALLRKVGKTKEEKGQLPVVLAEITRDFVVAYNPEPYLGARKLIQKFREIAKKNDLAKIVIEEGEHLLWRMPKLKSKQSLRKAYQQLADGKITATAFLEARQKVIQSTRLSNKATATYANAVMEGVRIVNTFYVRKTKPGKLVKGAVEGLYKRLNEKIPSKIVNQLKRADQFSPAEMILVLSAARKHLGKREDLTEGQDVTYSLHPMLSTLDPHTDYIDPKTLAEFTKLFDGGFSGIGVQIRYNPSNDLLEVVTPIKGSPAYKKGMYAGDIITKIIRDVDKRGKPLPKREVLSTKGMSTTKAVEKISGRAGTKVKLIVRREGEKEPLEFEIIRGSVEVGTVFGYKRNGGNSADRDEWNYVIDPKNKICYIRIDQFTRNTYRDLAAVMRKLKEDVGIGGFILDLRDNPGGLLPSAVKISDLFIDDGVIVTVRERGRPEVSYVGRSDGSYVAFPMVCLVNGYSASASEIVSACLQDHGRAIVIGSRSYGKGSVQSILPFDVTGGRLKLTTASFWRPNGLNLNKASTKGRDKDTWGVSPNPGFKLKLSLKERGDLREFWRYHEIIPRPDRPREPDEITQFEDRQLQKALEYIRQQIQSTKKAKLAKGIARKSSTTP